MTFGLGGDVKEGEGFVVFVDFVTGDFALDDFGENAAHINSLLEIILTGWG